MKKGERNAPLPLQQIQITDDFWGQEMELVRREIIPYQWRALNDQVSDADPSFCIRNFQVAGRQNQERRNKGSDFEEPKFTFRGFQSLPEDEEQLEEKFYGFVFQDSDLYKWIESVAYSLSQHPDPELERLADQAVDAVCAAQQENGYLDTYYIIGGMDRIFTNLRDHHELYCFGHLTEAAVAYYQATGKTKLLEAARKFGDYIDGFFGAGEGKCKGYPGHEIAEMALVRLYEVTGEKRYLDLSYFFVNERGQRPYYFDREEQAWKIRPGEEQELHYQYYQAHLPVRQQTEAVGHAVRGVYLYSGMADLARYYEDSSLYEACERLWDNITQKKMYITGGIGGTHIGEAFSFDYDLPNDTAYAETCASIGLVFFARRMLQIHPAAKYANVMERALYNGILSGMALDGRSFFYVNPLEVVPEACRLDERKFHVKAVRQKWFGCACCPPNLARLLGSVGSYAYTATEDTLFVHLYIGAVIHKEITGQMAELTIESGHPWDGAVKIQIRGVDAVFTIACRIPDWCDTYHLETAEDAMIEEREGYLYITRHWKDQDQINLDFPMEIRFLAADTRVREDVGKVAVMRGPVVYCMEGADQGRDLHLVTICTDAEPVLEERQISSVSVKGIAVAGFRQEAVESGGLYQDGRKMRQKPLTLHLIPYYTWANRGENEMQVWIRRQ